MALGKQREYRLMKVNIKRLFRADVYFPQLDVYGTAIYLFINFKIVQ